MQNVNIVSAAPDLDRDGREDKYEINEGATGAIRLETQDASRQQVINHALALLADSASPSGQAAYRTLVVYSGEDNAGLIQAAVDQHSATAVQAAATAVTDLVAQYQEQGLGDAAVLAAFQSGEATATIHEASDTPLSEAQLSAVADMVLRPQRRVTRTELVTVIGREAAAEATTEQAVIQAIGMGQTVSASGFGGQTGNVRGVLAGARAMNLSPAELARTSGNDPGRPAPGGAG